MLHSQWKSCGTDTHTPTHLFLGISQVLFGLYQQLFDLGRLLLPLVLLQLQSLCRHRHKT